MLAIQQIFRYAGHTAHISRPSTQLFIETSNKGVAEYSNTVQLWNAKPSFSWTYLIIELHKKYTCTLHACIVNSLCKDRLLPEASDTSQGNKAIRQNRDFTQSLPDEWACALRLTPWRIVLPQKLAVKTFPMFVTPAKSLLCAIWGFF
jgi:hypothetical protein